MDFTIGIITSDGTNKWLPRIIESVRNLGIPNYEIIIVGEHGLDNTDGLILVPFDETIKDKWITKKKNLITENAKYDNIVYMHDYHVFDNNWYEGFKEYGDDFKVCSNRIINSDGTRYRDWVWWDWNVVNINREHLIPYTESRGSRWMYINGSYWVAKKEVMKEFPLNEDLVWLQQDDIEWSKRVTTKYNFSFNPNSSVHMMKYHDPYWQIMSNDTYNNVLLPFLNNQK